MSLPSVLLVDDSQAVLAYEREALSGLYRISTAADGVEGLDRARELLPDAIVLDLSMPRMDGDAVLDQLKADAATRHIPVVIVSSEGDRARACVKRGAFAYLPKPIRADELRAMIARAIEDAELLRRRKSLAVMPVAAGAAHVGLPLDAIAAVVLQPLVRPLRAGGWVTDVFQYRGSWLGVLDLARPLRVAHDVPFPERKLVVVRAGEQHIGLCVDRVFDPEVVDADRIRWRADLGGSESSIIPERVIAVVQWRGDALAVLDPSSLVSRRTLASLSAIAGSAVQSLRAS